MKKIFMLVMFVVLICPVVVFADHPLVTDEAETLAKGGFEFELNGEYAQNEEEEDNVKVEETESELEVEAAYGIMEDLEVYVQVPYVSVSEKVDGESEDASGVGDIETGIKYRFFEKDEFGLAVKPFVLIPTGDEEKGLGYGKTSYGIKFIASKEMDPIAIHLNVGYARLEYEIEEVKEVSRNDIYGASLAVEWMAVKDLRIVGNVGIETNQVKEMDEHPAFALAGVIYEIGGGFAVDAGVRVGITEPAEDYAILVGLSYEYEPGSGSGDDD